MAAKVPAAALARHRYPGVNSFEEDDRLIFFGREAAARELLLRVLSVRLLLQFAPSGVGKTSLLNAGLFPELRRAYGCFPFTVRLNISSERLIDSIVRSMTDAARKLGLRDPVIPQSARNVWELLGQTQLWGDDLTLLTPVLVFDQFEEVFTLRDEQFRAEFAREIGALATGRAPEEPAAERPVPAPAAIKIIISLREEYLGRLEEFTAAIPSLFHERLRLAPLTHEEAREAMIRPAQAKGSWLSPQFEFETETLGKLIDYIDGTSETIRIIETLTLQLVCRRAEEIAALRRAAPDEKLLVRFEEFGGQAGLDRLVLKHFSNVLSGLPTALDRRRCQRLFDRGLLDPNGKRLMLEEGEIARHYRVHKDSLGTLVEGRLLRREPRSESTFYEISHDRLAESIAKLRGVVLPRWLKVSMAAAVAAVPLVVLGFIVQSHYLREAEAAQRQAEAAFGVLLGEDLVSRLREQGVGDSLGIVLRKAHIDEADVSIALARKLRHEGDVRRERGTLKEARQKFEQALTKLDHMLARAHSPSPDLTFDKARCLHRLGMVHGDLGHIVDAEATLKQAVDTWKSMPSTDAGVELEFAESLEALANIRNRLGDPMLAQAGLQEAWARTGRVLSEAFDATERNDDGFFLLGTALQRYAELLSSRRLLWDSGDERAAAAILAFAHESQERRPLSQLVHVQAGVAAAEYARLLTTSNPERATELFAESKRLFQQLAGSDPNNRLMQRERAAIQTLIAFGTAQCARNDACRKKQPADALDEADMDALDALGQFRRLSAQDPDSDSLRRDVVWGLQTRAEIAEIRPRGNSGESTQSLLEEGLALTHSVEPRDFHAAWDRIDLLMRRSRLREQRADLAAAGADFESAEKIAAQLPDTITRTVFLVNIQSVKLEFMRRSGQQAAAQELRIALEKLRNEMGTPWDTMSNSAVSKNKAAIDAMKAGPADDGQKVALYQTALRDYESAIEDYPFEFGYWENARIANEWNYSLMDPERNVEEAEKTLRKSVRLAWMARILSNAGLETEKKLKSDRIRESEGTLYTARRTLAKFQREHNQPQDAYVTYVRALSDAEGFLSATIASAKTREDIRNARIERVHSNIELGLLRQESKRAGWRESLQIGLTEGNHLMNQDPADTKFSYWLGTHHLHLAELLRESGQMKDAEAEFRLAARACGNAIAHSPHDAEQQRVARQCLDDIAALRDAEGKQ